MRKIHEILRQRHEMKLSYRAIANSLNISIGSVADYLHRAKAAALSWPLPEDISEQELYERLFLPAKTSAPKRALPDWEWVHRERRRKGVTLQLLWREYRDEHEGGLSYSQFCDRYRRYTQTLNPSMRQVHKAGEKTFVDYAGMTMEWIEPATGEIHTAQIFVGALGASQFTFVEATATQSLPDWIASHVRMWDYFGGVSEMVVPDNLKSAVTKTHRYDPDINANYQHVSEHYGFAIVPARVYKPKDKAKVENAVGCIERQILAPLRHRTFTSLGELNEAIKEKLIEFNQKKFQKLNTSRKELFETLERPALKPLPKERYHYAVWQRAKVNIDYHVVVEHHYYSVPYKYIHKEIELRVTQKTLECFYQGERIALHQRDYTPYKHSTLKEHMPANHQAQSEWSPERMKRWANKIGPQTKQFIEHLMAARSFPEQAYRTCLGVLRLAQRYGEHRLEAASKMAYDAGATRYQQIETILKNKIDTVPETTPVVSQAISPHENIRGAEYYQ